MTCLHSGDIMSSNKQNKKGDDVNDLHNMIKKYFIGIVILLIAYIVIIFTGGLMIGFLAIAIKGNLYLYLIGSVIIMVVIIILIYIANDFISYILHKTFI